MKLKKIQSLMMGALFAAGLLATQSVRAQGPQHPMQNHEQKTPEQMAQSHAEKMKTELGLTADQTEKVKTIELESMNQMRTMQSDNSLTQDAKKEKMKALRMGTHNKIKAVLTADQIAKMEAKENANKQDAMNLKGKKKTGKVYDNKGKSK